MEKAKVNNESSAQIFPEALYISQNVLSEFLRKEKSKEND